MSLFIVSTPIGNLEDITLRAIRILTSVDTILCEDTRRTGLLLQHLHIKKPLIPYYEEIEDRKIPEIIALLQHKSIALVSDAGTPLISDPGFKLVRECIQRGIKVESIPGPSAAIAALTSSGLPPDKFIFLGFVNKKNFPSVKPGVTAIFYAAPHKLVQNLKDLGAAFGDIEIVVCRELTKVHEEIWKGAISQALSHFSHPKGEFVLLFQGANPKASMSSAGTPPLP